MQQLNRLQNRNDFLLGDVQTGSVSRIFRDESKTWVEAIDDINWIDDGRAFLWVSERDGWRHVYRVPVPSARGNGADPGAAPGGEVTLLTRFDADVTDLVGLDIKQGWLYFRASPSNATQRYLYRAPLDGSAPPERITPGDQPGWHGYIMAPGGRLAFHTVSRFDTPPRMDVVELPSHKSLRTLTDPSALQAAIAPIVNRPVEFMTVDVGDGVSLDGWVLKPSQFDPLRKYPVIVFTYGEPGSQTVVDQWGGATMLFHRALADAGYVVVSFDNRGTPAPKGAAWRKVVYGTSASCRRKSRRRLFARSRRGIRSWTLPASASGAGAEVERIR